MESNNGGLKWRTVVDYQTYNSDGLQSYNNSVIENDNGGVRVENDGLQT